MTRKIQIISLFPDMFEQVFNSSILGRAFKNNLVQYSLIDLRQFGLGKRKQVDDVPYGGGQGMLLMIEPLLAAIKSAKANDPHALVVLPTPRGKQFKQSDAQQLVNLTNGLIFLCARYEGYDERIINWVDKTYSIGSYILTGGELATMVIIDSFVRLIPGALGSAESLKEESFSADDDSIEYPQYTRPASFQGYQVPAVLLSGNHEEIIKWRKNQIEK